MPFTPSPTMTRCLAELVQWHRDLADLEHRLAGAHVAVTTLQEQVAKVRDSLGRSQHELAQAVVDEAKRRA